MKETSASKSKAKNILGKIVKYVLPLILGVLIVYFFMKGKDPRELWAILKDANWGILLFSLLFGLLGNTLRGYRWELLIKPLGYSPKISNLNFAIYGGYAVNFALPRAGEIWRCGVIAKEEDIPFTKLVGTMILDRIFDTLTVLVITIIAFFLNMQFLLKQSEQSVESFRLILTSPYLYAGIFICLLTAYVVLRFFRNNFLVKKLIDLIVGMFNDMKSIWKMKTKTRLLLLSISIWVSYFFYFYITFFAFDFTENLGFIPALVAFALSSISMGVPSNGGLGPWQAAVIAALAMYGVDSISATAFATGVFALQSLWVILCGLVGMAALAIRNKRK